MKIAIIGHGYWGAIIYQKLKVYEPLIVPKCCDYAQLNEYDLFIISTQTKYHVDIITKLHTSNKLIFCEKPITNTLQVAKDLVKNNRIYISDVYLHNPEYKRIKEFIQHVKVNEFSIRTTNSSKSQKDSIYYDLMYHDIYMILDLFGISYTINNVIILQETKDIIEVTFMCNIIKIHLYYSRKDDTKDKCVRVLYDTNSIKDFNLNYNPKDEDSISLMFNNIINGNYDLSYNNSVAINTLEILKTYFIKIHIIGGGIYGCVCAHQLSKKYKNVILYERNSELIQESSAYNLLRIHNGYHYPRSIQTINNCKNSYSKFIDNYGYFCKKYKHYYCISKYNSKIDAYTYIDILKKNDLSYKKTSELDLLYNKNTIDVTIEVDECLYNPDVARIFFNQELIKQGVTIKCNNNVKEIPLNDIDTHILCTYNNTYNDSNEYIYQICEICYFQLHNIANDVSIVIMDGDFLSINPYKDDLHIVYDVENTIIYQEECVNFNIPNEYNHLVNKGIITNTDMSNYKLVKGKIKYFFQTDVMYHGSTYTIRIFKKDKNNQDNRPFIVDKSNNVFKVFSSKICNSILVTENIERNI